MPAWLPRRRSRGLHVSVEALRPQLVAPTATIIGSGDAAAADVQANGTAPASQRRAGWQRRALDFYDQLGPVWYAGQFYAKPLSKVELVLRRRLDNGDLKEVVDADAQAVLDRIQGPNRSGRSELQAQYGRLKFLTGDARLVVTQPLGGAEQWEMLSLEEARIGRDGKLLRYRNGPNTQPEEFIDVTLNPPTGRSLAPDEALVYRLWTQHPRYSGLADSPMRASVPVCEEIWILSLAILAHASSRAARNGLFLIPEEASFPDADPNDDADAATDRFISDVTDAFLRPIREPGQASAAAPIMLRVGEAYIEAFRHIEFGGDKDYKEKELRDEAIRLLATGLDLPPEVLLGTADVNHWGSWLISEKEWDSHVEPVARSLCEDLTNLILHPLLPDEKHDIIFWYDATAAVVPADRTTDAAQAHDRYAISDEAYRREAGFDETDAPDEDELLRRIALKEGDATLLTTGEPAPPAPSPIPPAAPDAPPTGDQPADAPAAPPAPAGDQSVSAASILEERCKAAAGMVVARARAKAGQRAANGKTRSGLSATPGAWCSELAATGASLDPSALVAGASAEFEAEVASWRLGDYRVDETGASILLAAAERHAAATLLEPVPPPLPDGVLELCGRAVRRET